MKKFVSLLTAGLILSSSVIMSVYADDIPEGAMERASKADFNADGKITNEDAEIVLNYFVKSRSLGTKDEALEKAYDISGDGKVTALDSSYILYYIDNYIFVNIEDNIGNEDFSYFLSNVSNDKVSSITDTIRGKASQADLNSDGRISTDDSLYILEYCAEKAAHGTTDEIFENLADMNEDGTINSIDAAFVLKYVAENNLPGDINEDGIVTSADASYLLKYVADCSDGSMTKDKNIGIK